MAETWIFYIFYLFIMTASVIDTNKVDGQYCSYNSDFLLESPFRIGSWNAQRLGRKKIQDPTISNFFAKVISKYDIIALQEVTDKSEEYIYELLQIVNEVAYVTSEQYKQNVLPADIPNFYNVTISARVGRTSHKEQYAFFYRIETVSLIESILYPDVITDNFTYDPFIAVFNTPTINVDKIALVTIHTSPSLAKEEIDALVKVHDYVANKFKLNDIVILGDYNAGCKYVTTKDWDHISLYTDTRFTWLISDHIDTTAKMTSCPYDRIVVAGKNLTEIVYENSAKAFHFDNELEITDEDLVTSISDHFPVEIYIKGNVKTTLSTSIGITVGAIMVSKESVENLVSPCQTASDLENELAYRIVPCLLNKSGDLAMIKKRLLFNYYLNQTSYFHITINELADPLCLGDEWYMKFSKLEEFILICGRRPYYLNQQGDIKQLGYSIKGTGALLDFIQKMSSTKRCIFTNEVDAILRYKIKSGALVDASLFMEEISDYKTIHLYFLLHNNMYMCYISINGDVPIM